MNYLSPPIKYTHAYHDSTRGVGFLFVGYFVVGFDAFKVKEEEASVVCFISRMDLRKVGRKDSVFAT